MGSTFRGEEKPATTPGTSVTRDTANRILPSSSSLEGERKQVTVLFADVAGFTRLSEKMDPEEVRDLLRPAIGIMAEEIHAYEGTVAQFMGDGLMALFGAPLAHEDDPQRALYAALAMQRRLREYEEKLDAKGLQLQMRIGINTGLVILGSIGDDQAMEYTAIGDTVNLASRMESTCEPGTIQVSENTYHLTQGYFDFSDLGEMEMKGKEEPVRAWRVLGELPSHTRISASLTRGLSPFVGRERELDQLTYSYQQARSGHGQVVGIVGEPGAGKSRLVLEFTRSLPEEDYTYLEGGCIHYGEAIAYLPILGMLRKYFDIGEGEEETESKRKLEERLSSLDGQLARILPPLQELLFLSVDDDAYLSLEPAQRRGRVFDAIRYLLIAESQTKPLILAIEDLQWMDRTSEEFLAHLIDSIPTASVLLLLLYRPEYTPDWVSKTFYSQIRVDQLPGESGANLVRSILSGGQAANELTDFIITRTAGNPLFIEELTRGLLESRSILIKDGRYVLAAGPEDIQVPETIQGIIASRLDGLDESLKGLTQVAAVIGREFAFRLLQAITDLEEELRSRLACLQEMELIYEKSLFPELEYIFKHALTQEVAYQSLLRKRRREIHARIGQAIERIYTDRLEEFFEILAYHYQRSDDPEKAIRYLKLSGDKAVRSYSNWEAVDFYREAIRLLEAQPESNDNRKKKMEVCLATIYPLYLLNYPEGSMDILQEAERLCEDMGGDRDLAKIYGILARHHTLKGNSSPGLEYCEKCFDAAERSGDIYTMALTAFDICVPLYYVGRVADVGILSGRVIRLMEEYHREHDIRVGGLMVYSHQCGWYGYILALSGEFDGAENVFKRGLKYTFGSGDTFGTGWIEQWYCVLSIFKGDPDGVIKHARKAIQCFEETGVALYLGMPWNYLGFGYYMLGKYDEAIEYAQKGLEINLETGAPIVTPQLESLLAVIQLDAGDTEKALSSAEDALKLSREYRSKTLEAFALLYLGRIEGLVDPSRIDAGLMRLRQCISTFDEMGARTMASLGYMFLGEVYEKAGLREEALENLQRADEMYGDRVKPSSYFITRTREAMARLS